MKASAFGVQPQVEHVKMPLRFAGQYSDDEVGLFYNYFRFYNPETGRYVENDPIDLKGGLNRYGYVNGNPLHNIDPTGELAIPFPVIVNTVANIAIQATRMILSSMIKDVVKDNVDKKDEDDDCNDKCGPLTRVQAYQKAQQIAHISRKERYLRPVDETSLNATSRGRCYNYLKQNKAKHLGYGCEWQKSWIEDHPDGHPSLPGEPHHDCPHLHVYVNGKSVAIITYKRNY